MKASLSTEILRASIIPSKFWKLGVDTFEGNQDALDQVHTYAKRFKTAYENGTGLLLEGPPHTFKTFLATYVLKYLLLQGLQVHYFDSSFLIHEWEAKRLLPKIGCKVHCIVLDNVENGNDYYKSIFGQVVNFRSDYGLPYIVCSTFLDFSVWAQYFTPKIAKKLSSDLIRVDCDGEHVSAKASALSESAKEKLIHRKFRYAR